MAYQQNNPQIFGGFLYQNLFNYDNTSKLILDLDRGWNSVYQFVSTLAGKSIGTTSPDGSYKRILKRRQEVLATIQTATQSGAGLILTFTDPTYTGFRTKDSVRDDNMTYGYVTEVRAGGVTIIPKDGGTLTAGTHFAAGQTIYAFYDQSGNMLSNGKTNLYKTVEPQTDYVAVQRDSLTVSRREKFKTFAGHEGIAYLWHENEQDMIRRMMRNYGRKILYGEGALVTSPIDGLANDTVGMRYRIINDGAYTNISGTQPFTWDELTYMGNAVANTEGSASQELVVWIDRVSMANLQRERQDFVKYAGKDNTVGGVTVNGINFMTWAEGGITYKFMIQPYFSDVLSTPTSARESVWIMDLTPTTGIDVNGNITQESPLQKIHWGSDEEQIYRIQPGMTGGNLPMRGDEYSRYDVCGDTFDGMRMEMLFDNGISYVADRSAIFERKLS